VSNYTQSTNFATKDNLSSGDPLKIVKGTEINTEFANIAIAVATKADLASPTFTGTPAAPTASAGTNSTQIATTAYADNAITAERTATATLTNKSLTSPTLTGTPVAPTAALNTSTTQIATTAFVVDQIADDAPTKSGSGATGTWGISISGNAATATAADNAIGVGQSWQDVTGSRSSGSTYTNSTGRTICISVSAGTSGNDATVQIYVNGNSIAYTASRAPYDQDAWASAIIPNGATYRADAGNGLRSWWELR
jgi:hypothetical protein